MADFSWNDIKRIFDAKNVPVWIWYPLLWAESRGDPNAVGDGGCSIGLFQLNRCVGQGAGYTVEQLKDPIFNTRIAAERIASAWEKVKVTNLPQPTQALNVARMSGHPMTGNFEEMVSKFFSAGQKLGANLGSGAGGIVLQGPGGNGINVDFGDWSGGNWSEWLNFDKLDPFNVLLVAGGSFVIVLVVISFIFQSETVRKVVIEGGKTAAKVAPLAL